MNTMSTQHEPDCTAQTSYHGQCSCRPTRTPYQEPNRRQPLSTMKQTKHASACLAAQDPHFACTCDPIEENLLVQASRPSPAELIRRAKQRGLFKPRNEYGF